MHVKELIDSHSRVVRSLRLSVTDRCNLRCSYCCTEEPVFLPYNEFLSYAELLEVLSICVEYGVEKLRITGGEPFVRKNLISFLADIGTQLPTLDVRITTNGVLLEEHLATLEAVGIRHLNISLDTFNKSTFARITGKDYFSRVYSAILKSIERGFSVKLNAVAMKGVNDMELEHFVHFALEHPVSVRFIEYMPISTGTVLDSSYFWSAEDIMQEVASYVSIQKCTRNGSDGPATVYTLDGGKGTFGVITPLSNHFCDTCDRLRLTASGGIRTCLYSENEYSIKEALRSGAQGHNVVRTILENAILEKPIGVELLDAREGKAIAGKSMSAIGG